MGLFFLIVLKLTSLYFALIKIVSRSANTCKKLKVADISSSGCIQLERCFQQVKL